MKPIIGITASLENGKMIVDRSNSDSIFRAGGIPLVLPYTMDEKEIEHLAERMDGLLLTGGGDIDPTLFGEEPLPGLGSICPERDALETALIRHMLDADKPIFGICRGCQILNIAAGGDMYQDLYTQRDNLLQHSQKAPRWHASHTLQVEEGTLLHQIAGVSTYKVNSFHHQAVRNLAPGFIQSASTKDGVIEAFESRQHRFVLGVQWHPECMTEIDPISQRLFDAFVGECKRKL
jgi:putative glutamine amidotransferase